MDSKSGSTARCLPRQNRHHHQHHQHHQRSQIRLPRAQKSPMTIGLTMTFIQMALDLHFLHCPPAQPPSHHFILRLHHLHLVCPMPPSPFPPILMVHARWNPWKNQHCQPCSRMWPSPIGCPEHSCHGTPKLSHFSIDPILLFKFVGQLFL